jgi:hypothetical protein
MPIEVAAFQSAVVSPANSMLTPPSAALWIASVLAWPGTGSTVASVVEPHFGQHNWPGMVVGPS